MLLSILIPTYNRRALLPRALESVFQQNIGDYEVIIVDDGSTDETEEFVKSLSDSRISYLRRTENRGIGYTRKEAVENARGQYLAFIDTDDIWLKGKLELQLKFFEKNPDIDVLFCNFINKNEMENNQSSGFFQTQRGLNLIEKKPLDDHQWVIVDGMPEALLTANFIATSSVMLRKSIVVKSGNFNPNLSGPEDFEFWWRLSLIGAKFAYLDLPLVIRNKNESSISGVPVKFVLSYIEALHLVLQESILAGRNDLIRLIRFRESRAWSSLIFQYGQRQEKYQAWNAFLNSIRINFSPKALFFLTAAFLGPVQMSKLKMARKRLI